MSSPANTPGRLSPTVLGEPLDTEGPDLRVTQIHGSAEAF